MENLIEFEEDKIIKLSALILSTFYMIFFFNHFFVIYKLFNNNQENKNNKSNNNETSCICILSQLINCILFFYILENYRIKNTEYLNVTHLIGILLSFEWIFLYIYYYKNGNLKLTILIFFCIFIFISIIIIFFYIKNTFSKKFETILKHITFIFYIFMFNSPGLNIFKLICTGNPNFISISNPITGIFVNIGMIFFIFSLNKYKIIELYFIIYGFISLIFCIFEIIFYFCKTKGLNRNIERDINEMTSQDEYYNNDNDSAHKKISLISRNSIEED